MSNPCPRKSVGAVIKNGQGDYLCLYRLKFPKGLAFVAGHLDYTNQPKGVLELPFLGLKREVFEESGLTVIEARLVLQQTFSNPCSGGFDGHEWFVYEVTDYRGTHQLQEPDKHAWVRWLNREAIQEFIQRNDCDPAWQNFIWPALRIV